MKIKRELYFAIHTKNKAGDAASVTAALVRGQVECSGVWAFATGSEDAEIFVVPKDAHNFMALAKSSNWQISEGTSFHLEGRDQSGVLAEILRNLSDEGINLKAVDAITVEGHFSCYLFPQEKDIELIAQLLGLSTPKA